MTRFPSVLTRKALALGARGLVERGAQSLGELQGVINRPEMQEEQSRLLVQHVAVDRRHVDAVRSQLLDHRVHFVAGKNKISSDGGLAAIGRLKTDGVRHAQWPD